MIRAENDAAMVHGLNFWAASRKTLVSLVHTDVNADDHTQAVVTQKNNDRHRVISGSTLVPCATFCLDTVDHMLNGHVPL